MARARKPVDRDRPPKAINIEPRVGFRFVSHIGENGDEFRIVQRVIRQGTGEHGQDLVWTIEEHYDGVRDDRPVTIKALAWIIFDEARGEWVRVALYQEQKARRGSYLYTGALRDVDVARAGSGAQDEEPADRLS